MKHRRARATIRKENKRLDEKKARAAEAQAMRGDRVRTARGMGWGSRLRQPPVLEDSPIGKSQKKRKGNRPKWNKPCLPSRKNHGWMKDIEIVDISHWYGGQTYRYERRFKLCVYCGLEKEIRRRYLR